MTVITISCAYSSEMFCLLGYLITFAKYIVKLRRNIVTKDISNATRFHLLSCSKYLLTSGATINIPFNKYRKNTQQ